MRIVTTVILVAILAPGFGACTFDGSPLDVRLAQGDVHILDADTGPDFDLGTGIDTPVEDAVEPDVEDMDAAVDPDVQEEVEPDTPPDTEVADVVSDVPADAVPDTMPDATPDTLVDTDPDTVPDADAGHDPDSPDLPDAPADADVMPDLLVDAAPDADVDAEADVMPDLPVDAAPDADAEPDVIIVPSPEVCYGDIDEDLDGLTDCQDEDCYWDVDNCQVDTPSGFEILCFGIGDPETGSVPGREVRSIDPNELAALCVSPGTGMCNAEVLCLHCRIGTDECPVSRPLVLGQTAFAERLCPGGSYGCGSGYLSQRALCDGRSGRPYCGE